MILLGFEIGTGRRVEIPETGHLAWFGQTQLSGKTTALEAIAFRGHLKAVAFITKQGEGGFLTGRMIQPYFSEPTNDEEQPLWRWVKSILEASQGRRLNFEESWIIRCCEEPKQAKTLADVHSNIKALIGGEGDYIEKGRGKKKKREWKYSRKPVSGINAGVYTSLKAYFDIVMPQLARLPYTKKLDLGPGLNVMNLQGYAMETQALVIRSVMEWVYQHEKNVRVIVPEAQDFVPQGKNSPVKMACENLVRKAGANKNFMWLDSQDMAAVDKFALRACSIVGIGVQTEAHEIDRSLATMFSPALKPIDVARLKIGEFFVRTSEARVSKVYVQPAWMDSEIHAQAIAKGQESVAGARQMLRAFKDSRKEVPPLPQLQQLMVQEIPDGETTEQKPIEADEQSILQTSRPGHTDDSMRVSSAVPVPHRDRGPAISDNYGASRMPDVSGHPDTAKENNESAGSRIRSHESPVTSPEDESMWKEKYEALEADHKTLIEAHDFLAAEVRRLQDETRALNAALLGQDALTSSAYECIRESSVPCDEIAPDGELCALVLGHSGKHSNVGPFRNTRSVLKTPVTDNGKDVSLILDEDLRLGSIYNYVKARASKDPGILELLTRQPELRVKVERVTIQAHSDKLDGKIALLIKEGFFDKPRTRIEIGTELKRRGALAQSTNMKILSPFLAKLTSQGFFTVEKDGLQSVPGMKVSIE